MAELTINPQEITEALRRNLEGWTPSLEAATVGDGLSIGAVIMGEASHIQEGDTVRQTGKVLSIPVGDALLGRVVDTLGNPMDGKGPLGATETRLLGAQGPSGVS